MRMAMANFKRRRRGSCAVSALSSARLDARERNGFSLVELLVVIGIIALLLGLLMPALSGFRQRAREVQCQATLRNIGYAGQLHANDRRGRLPLGGWQFNPVGGVVNPAGVGDAEEK